MKLSFLCADHTERLQDSPGEALQLWLDCDARLSQLSGSTDPHSVRLAGSALEAANIYLRSNPTSNRRVLRRYLASALLLIEMLGELRQIQSVIVVIALATAVVEQVAVSGGDHKEALAVARTLIAAGSGFTEPMTQHRAGTECPREKDAVIG